jgi:hypothetical protein
MIMQDYGDWIAPSSTHSTWLLTKVVIAQLQYLKKLGFDIFHICQCNAIFEPHIQNTLITLSSESGFRCVCWW